MHGEGKIHMTRRAICSVLVSTATVASLTVAPVANATQTCHDAGSVVRCETSGSVSLKATPQARAPHVGQINGNLNGRRGIVWSW